MRPEAATPNLCRPLSPPCAPQQVKPVSATVDIPGTDWAQATTNDGKIYFYSKTTRETSWSLPPEVTLKRTSDPPTPGAVAALSDATRRIHR